MQRSKVFILSLDVGVNSMRFNFPSGIVASPVRFERVLLIFFVANSVTGMRQSIAQVSHSFFAMFFPLCSSYFFFFSFFFLHFPSFFLSSSRMMHGGQGVNYVTARGFLHRHPRLAVITVPSWKEIDFRRNLLKHIIPARSVPASAIFCQQRSIDRDWNVTFVRLSRTGLYNWQKIAEDTCILWK